MEINIVAQEKTLLEFEISGADYTIPELIVARLFDDDGVEFASYKVDHPLVGKPRVIVRTKSKDALTLTLAAIAGIREDVSALRKELKKSK